MKRWLIGLLAALLLLSGCDAKPGQETVSTTPQQTTVPTTVPAGPSLYLENSDLEEATQGALRLFAPERGSLYRFGLMGQDPVLVTCCEDESYALYRIDPVTGQTLAQGSLPSSVDPFNGLAMNENRLACYDAESNAILVLDQQLRQLHSVKIPQTVTGSILITADLSVAYYNTDGELRALDLNSGISRLLLQLSDAYLDLNALLFDGSVINCRVNDAYGAYEGFFSTEDGRSLGQDPELMSAASQGDRYLVRRFDGPVMELLLGTRDGQVQSFTAAGEEGNVSLLPQSGMLVERLHDENGAVLQLYETQQGNRKSRLAIPMIYWVGEMKDDAAGNIWFMTTDPELDRDVLCCWQPQEDADQVVRLSKRYTAQEPDMAGLAECKALAQELEARFYVDIGIYTDSVEPNDYAFAIEYQVSVIREFLTMLETVMSKFPEGFFQTGAKVTESGKFQISLVRDIKGTQYNTVNDAEGLQYWIGGDAYIAIMSSADMEKTFYHELSHALDTYIYAKSIYYDFWDDQNPDGFTYDNSYTQYQTHWDSQWLEAETRAFIDAYSMTYAHEDRARVMEYAMSEGNEAYFQTETMQAKLKQLCLAIREAFGWKKYEGTFIWEQYLNESLAYTKKK